MFTRSYTRKLSEIDKIQDQIIELSLENAILKSIADQLPSCNPMLDEIVAEEFEIDVKIINLENKRNSLYRII